MRCLNSPPVLNSLENKIVESAPTEARHVLVVNAGDGRLARALAEKIGAGTKISVVTLQPGLLPLVDDLAARGSDAWDLAWHEKQVAAHGGFDLIVFYQLQEFWRGELNRLQQILALARPGALVWTSFLNAQATQLMARFLPPVRLGFSAMGDPVRLGPNLDFASFVDFAGRMGGRLTDLWGMLDQNAQEFCQKKPDQPAQWESRGIKVTVKTYADAFLWGATVVGVAFRLRGAPDTEATPTISFSPFNVNLLQALVLPYPDQQSGEGTLGAARIEAESWRQAPGEKLGNLAKTLLDQVGDTDKPQRILLVGAGWGRDLLLLKKNYPAWDVVGWERNSEMLAIGQDLIEAAGLTAASGEKEGRLPFDDQSFDLAFSFGGFSTLYEPAARQLVAELKRIVKGAVFHLEDGRGPEQGLHLKSYSLKGVYAALGVESTVQPVLVDGNPVGMYVLKAAGPA